MMANAACGSMRPSPGSFVTDPKQSKVADKVGFALAPDNGLGKRGNWLWAWSLAVPAGSTKIDAAEKFISWATSKHYLDLVAQKEGMTSVPPGTRTSLYKNPDYLKAAPFAQLTLDSINSADPTHPTVKPVPVHRRAVCRDPGIPGHRRGRRARLLRGARRNDDRRRGARQGAGQHGSGDEEGRLYEMTGG